MKSRDSFIFIHSALAAFCLVLLTTSAPELQSRARERVAIDGEGSVSVGEGPSGPPRSLSRAAWLSSFGLLTNAALAFVAYDRRIAGAMVVANLYFYSVRPRTFFHVCERAATAVFRNFAIWASISSLGFFVDSLNVGLGFFLWLGIMFAAGVYVLRYATWTIRDWARKQRRKPQDRSRRRLLTQFTSSRKPRPTGSDVVDT